MVSLLTKGVNHHNRKIHFLGEIGNSDNWYETAEEALEQV